MESLLFIQFFLLLCTISCVRFAKLTSNMPVVFLFPLFKTSFFYVQFVAVVSLCQTKSLDRESLVML